MSNYMFVQLIHCPCVSQQTLFLGAPLELFLGNVRYRCNVHNLNVLSPEFLINTPMTLYFS